jgi:hypothetical protein
LFPPPEQPGGGGGQYSLVFGGIDFLESFFADVRHVLLRGRRRRKHRRSMPASILLLAPTTL